MANPFYFPQAFAQNPIQSFIDGKLAAQERTKKERDRQVDLWYRYQQLQMSKAKHDASMSMLKQRAANMEVQAKLNRQFADGTSSGYGAYYNGARRAPADFQPVRAPMMDAARAAEGASPYSSRFSPPMRLGGPVPQDDDLSITYEGPGRSPGGVTADGYPEVMTYEEAQKLYGLPGGDDTANVNTRRDAYFGAGGKVGGGRLANDPFAGLPGYVPGPAYGETGETGDPFYKPAKPGRRHRYDEDNTANDEFMLNFYGGF